MEEDNTKSARVNALLEDAQRVIEENDALIGIANVEHVNSEYEEYLNYSSEELNKLDKEDCITIQYTLTRYAISVNKKKNKLETTLGINKTLFNRELAKVWESYSDLGFMSSDLKVAHACNEYKYLQEMQDEIIKLDGVIHSMEGLLGRIDGMIKIFNNLSYIKGRN